MTPFFKLSGGGNDFIALVEPASEPSAQTIRDWCCRGKSLGGDGLFTLARRRTGAARMRYYNSDGHPADLCVNGTRCAIQLATLLGWSRGDIDLATDAGTIRGRALDAGRAAIELPRPDRPQRARLEVDDTVWEGWTVAVGVPHLVLVWNTGLDLAPVDRIGPILRRHPALGEAGANVDFVKFPSPGRLEIRTYERGVEAETLACGSGVLAAVAAGLESGDAKLPVQALTQGGFTFDVGLSKAGEPSSWTLTGDARIVGEGTLLPGALDLPKPAVWT